MTQVKDGIVQTVMQTTLVWLLLPIAWNKTDTSFIMSELFYSQGWNKSDSPVYNTCLATSASSLELNRHQFQHV